MPDSPHGEAVAAVDLGSNSFHLVVARVLDGVLRVEDRHKEQVMLAAGLDAEGRLDDAALGRALDCLRRFRQRLDGIPDRRIRVAATDAFRSARRPADFHARAEEALGHAIAVIHGEEEARLVYRGIRYDLGRSERLMLAFDIGGGSTEIVQGRGEDPDLAVSLRMGSSNWSERYFPEGKIGRRRMERATLAARHEVEPLRDAFLVHRPEFTVGSSGTCLSLAKVLEATGATAGGLELEALRALQRELSAFEHVDEIDLPGLKEARRPVLLGGLCVLVAVMQELEVESAMTSQGALREGLLLDLVGRLEHADLRSRTVEELARRFHVDPKQAARVRASVMRLVDALQDAWGIDTDDRLFLGWAAQLLEIGRAVRHAGYHRHGAYLAANSDMPGFSLDESRMLAVLLRRHRGDLEERDFADLDAARRARTLRMLLPLRLAARVHRARRDRVLPVEMQARPGGLELRFPAGWLAAHPLTALDLEEEAADWRAVGFALDIRE